jgi:hypothetical protein
VTEFELGTKYCVTCGALLPLDEDSVPFFVSQFREPAPADSDEPEVGEQDVATSVRPLPVAADLRSRAATAVPPPMPSSPRVSAASPPRSYSSATTGRQARVPRKPSPRTRRRPVALYIGMGSLATVAVFSVGFVAASLTNGEPSPSVPQSGNPSGVTRAAPSLPQGAVSCSAEIGRSENTSCPFAQNVAAAVWAANSDSDSFTVKAFSPVTGKDYDLSCTRGEWITCEGGTKAVVYVLPK